MVLQYIEQAPWKALGKCHRCRKLNDQKLIERNSSQFNYSDLQQKFLFFSSTVVLLYNNKGVGGRRNEDLGSECEQAR